MKNLPKILPIFPLSNFIIFPKTTVPLNIFEPRYIDMINDSMKSNKLIGMVQPKKTVDDLTTPILHNIGCLGKISSFKETEDGRFLIELKGLIRFKIVNEIKSAKKYRECKVSFENFNHDLDEKKSQDLVSKGAIFCKSIPELVPKVTVLITCLPSPKSVKEVLLKSLPKLNQTHLWIEMSTTDEKDMRYLSNLVLDKNAEVLEAPITGGQHRAESGNISILSGGSR